MYNIRLLLTYLLTYLFTMLGHKKRAALFSNMTVALAERLLLFFYQWKQE